ncbi:6287_t:CDS:2, partial [Dentiscutata erythropus]
QKLNIREAITYIAKSWDEVKTSTIVNCWVKTEILPELFGDKIEDATFALFNNLNNSQILIENTLNKMQIVNIVLDEQQECEEGDTSDTNNKLSEVPVVKRLNGLKKFVAFFEQQKNNNFNIEDLRVFRKYMLLMGRKYIELVKQKSISNFFLPI